jgi:NADPH-dependent 2,4-dienoyl-CoA reductase/sulfur reductase-like enzyme
MIDRRDFLKLALAGGVLAASPWAYAARSGKRLGRVVVVGGGYAGATAAKYLRMWSGGAVDVVVVEPHAQFVSCPLSNLVLGGAKSISDLTFGYDALRSHHGIHWVRDKVTGVDAENRKITLERGSLGYDKLLIAPGVDFNYADLPALADKQDQIPHAWKAGWQTLLLRQQLEAMPDGGVFVMTIPRMPYKCPPGPYERACQVAFYFSQHKPKSKVIILDANPDIVSKKGLFLKAWRDLYSGMVDYRPNSAVLDVDPASLTVHTEFEQVQADVLNVIPPQQAGKPAFLANAVNIDQRWCQVDFLSYQSTTVPDVHIIGDAVSAPLPKSAHMATSQARIAAAAIIAILSGNSPDPAPVFANTCYSYVNDKMAMHVANVYRYDPDKKLMVPAEGGGVSEAPSLEEGAYARYWAENIWSDVLT